MKTRIEKDLIGEKAIPADAYYGVHTARAMENFPITGIPISRFPSFIKAFAKIKKAAALANKELGSIQPDIADVICQACDKVIAGEYLQQFTVDIIQGGAGTSTNMNVNEVIANIALEILGHEKGEYTVVSPNDDVNCSQSTNDTYPSSIKVALYFSLKKTVTEMERFVKALRRKGDEFKDVVKTGRTQLQDALPVTLGQTFNNYANQVEASILTIREDMRAMLGLNMGATAIGTGLTAHPDYKGRVNHYIKQVIGEEFYVMEDLFVGTQDASGFVLVSGSLKRFATQLSKICNDLRLLSSGPRCGFNEINLPSKQAGSSIMPGKVNPVIPEVVNQVCFQVIGHDVAVSFACEGGQLGLNAFEPLMVANVMSSSQILRNSLVTLRENCIDGITANVERCREYAENNISIVTALNPHIGYKKSTEIAKRCYKENRSVFDVAMEMRIMSEDRLREVLNVRDMVDVYRRW
ncbi:MAG: aspartate ammonia-lyase [Gammaproteobacteria bacterium]|nr:MAG: aspartate ammonia-lyase [Gammaproteobacteria bacterium]